MAVASLIPGATNGIDQLDLAVDGWLDPEFKFRSAIGESDVENGTKIHDHFTALPDMIKMTGIVDSIRSSGDRAADAWKLVRELHRTGAIVKVVAEFGIWDECVIKQASTTQKTRGLEFMIELQQINRIGLGSQSTIAPAALDPSNPAANRQPIVETGTKAPQSIDEAVPVVINADGTATEDVLAGGSRTDTVQIIDDEGTPTGRYTLKEPATGGD